MKLQLNPRDQRAFLFLAAALCLYGILRFAVFPLHDRLTLAGQAAAEKQDELRRFRRAQLRKGQYAELTELAGKQLKQAESVLVTAANPSLVSAELQSMVESTVSKTGITLSQRSIGTPKRLNEFYSEFPITLSFESTPAQLITLLAELRTLPKFVAVRSLQESPIQAVHEAPKNADLSKNVRVNMTVAVLSTAEMVKR